MRGALEADKQAAERGFDVGICRMHHINNNAGVATVTVVQMRAGAALVLGLAERHRAQELITVDMRHFGAVKLAHRMQ